jgi:hypothetical protein
MSGVLYCSLGYDIKEFVRGYRAGGNRMLLRNVAIPIKIGKCRAIPGQTLRLPGG